ncbi:hypothetical protein AAVH_17473 [Aphelenchoides avenae]|nr:hypothetical protein AAVH_17473 [Aphelenchus avenae]
MSDNQVSDAVRRYQKAYEERAAPIQQHIRRLADEHGRIQAIVRDNRPSAQDDISRLIQQHRGIRPLTQSLRTNIVEYMRADTEWNRTIDEFNLHNNGSAWAHAMLQERNAFYHGLSLTASPLDHLFAQLLEDAQRTLDDIESFIQAAPPRNVKPHSQRHTTGIRPTPSDQLHRSNARSRTFVNSSLHRNKPTGIM